MDYVPQRWALNGLRPMLLLAMGLTVLKDLTLRVLAWLNDWTCFWPRFGYGDPEANVALYPVIPVAHMIAQSPGCLNARWLMPAVFIGIAVTLGATFQNAERRRLFVLWIIMPLGLGLAFLRTLSVVAYNHAAWPFTYYHIDVPPPVSVMNEYELVGIFLIDAGILLLGIVLGGRIARPALVSWRPQA